MQFREEEATLLGNFISFWAPPNARRNTYINLLRGWFDENSQNPEVEEESRPALTRGPGGFRIPAGHSKQDDDADDADDV